MAANLDASRNYSFLAIAAFFGFLGFMMQPTAYTWGEQDMMPFFERIFDPNFLSNDFFTNTSIAKNPRWVYGYLVVALSWITTLEWYTVLFVLKLLFLTLAPVVYYQVIIVLLRKYVSDKALANISPFILLCLVLMVFLKEYPDYFSVASWLSYSHAVHAYNVSIVLCFIGVLLKERGRLMMFYLPFFFFGCLMHPAMGLFAIGFYAVFLVAEFKKELRGFLPVLMSGLFAILLVKLLFAAQQTMPTAEFIDIYVKERHPWHYSVPDYINRKGDWQIFFIGMNLLFIIPLVRGILKKNKQLWLLSFVSCVSYSGVIALQYIFTELVPLKVVAYLGVSRFTTFGYWMLVIIWAMMLSNKFNIEKTPVFPSLGLKNFVLILISLIFVGVLFLDNPKETNYINRKGYYDFVQSTPEDAIFVTYTRPLNTDMRMVGQRGVFIGDEFPFAEQYITEFGDRYKMIYGSWQNGLHGREYYRSLKPKDFLEISKKYQLDYILIENGHNTEFNGIVPAWENSRHSLYHVANLRP